MNSDNLSDQIYLLALVYSNDINSVLKIVASRNPNVDINFEHKIPLKKNAPNLTELISNLLVTSTEFKGLDDLIKKGRLFRSFMQFNKIEKLTPSDIMKLSINDLLKNSEEEQEESDNDDNNSQDPEWNLDLPQDDCYSLSLLKLSVIMEYKEMVNLLLYFVPSISPVELNELHPIHLALYKNNTHILKMLLSKLKERDIMSNMINRLIDNRGLNSLQIAILNKKHEAIDVLVMIGADVNFRSKFVKNTLVWAIEHLDLSEEMLVKILSIEADTNCVEPFRGLTPLGVAICKNRPELIRILAKNGANLNQKFGIQSTSPIKCAIDFGNKEILEILIEEGADINIHFPVFDQHLTGADLLKNPLLNAISLKNEEIVEILLKNGAHPHPIPSTLYSPLSSACVVNNKNIVQSLINYKADPTASVDQGTSPLSVCLFLVKFNFDFYN